MIAPNRWRMNWLTLRDLMTSGEAGGRFDNPGTDFLRRDLKMSVSYPPPSFPSLIVVMCELANRMSFDNREEWCNQASHKQPDGLAA